MFPGRFNDILRAGERYLALERDFGNLDEVCAAVRDVALLSRMADVACQFALAGQTYAHRARALLAAV